MNDSDGEGDGEGDSDGGESDSGSDHDPLEPVAGEVRCVPSLFPSLRSPTIYFDYPANLRSLGIQRPVSPGSEFVAEDLGGRKIFYKCVWERNCVKNAFVRAGFRRKLQSHALPFLRL
ncbi:hypothetical protein TeGR_g9801 [Tetraparma gracilis]|uniref:Uncharacterized protein n=1 Tax=Tetraparma gracilis TaxID=2962635 RepID=A0ABQ6MHC6_9STRA|nr:hypothetical protein TeGR_g9801 [Tetraparma gracilis]